ncbi:hypothetical protein BVC71_00315 [Marivivens niveibacter]|uniref:DUF2332 domain-containing protein n=1 Tax=Marivivens niveibacter TaxID=1930667 RepID=A0A251X046_9RHOB|nr:DUF2332 family protein [Marivivens niveibacter]OUD10002.1 hypothetical protein BVC71_00315 [Marivivens niveibacter]
MTARLTEALIEQANACEKLGSPFMRTLLELLAERLRPDTPLKKRLFNWPGDLGPAAESVPLRLTGALHALRMLDRCGLQDAYPPNELDIEILWGAVDWALDKEAAYISTFIDSPPQTNEVRRSAGLIAAGQWLNRRYGLPIDLREIGCSAGLNLMWDQFALNAGDATFGPADSKVQLMPDWQGNLPPAGTVAISDRRGVDLAPIDIHSPIDRLRLKSYIWPDQPQRMDMTDAAISMFNAKIDQADAVDWLSKSLSTRKGHLTLVYSTIAWQYLPRDAQYRGEAIMEMVGRATNADAPLAWLLIENDGKGEGAGISLRLWPNDLKLSLGRMDFHGRWVQWAPPV